MSRYNDEHTKVMCHECQRMVPFKRAKGLSEPFTFECVTCREAREQEWHCKLCGSFDVDTMGPHCFKCGSDLNLVRTPKAAAATWYGPSKGEQR